MVGVCCCGSGSHEVGKQGYRVKAVVGERNTLVVGAPNCQVRVCCGDCRAFGLGSRGRYGNNKLGGKLTEAPAVEVVLVVVLLVASFYMSLFDPLGLQATVYL